MTLSRKIICLSLSIAMIIPLCGFSIFGNSYAALDVKSTIVYTGYSVDALAEDFKNYDKAESKYDGHHVTVIGTIFAVAGDCKEITLQSQNKTIDGYVKVKIKSQLTGMVAKLQTGDIVRVYGQAVVHKIPVKEIYIDADEVSVEPDWGATDYAVGTVSGEYMTATGMTERNVGKAVLNIPKDWEAVESPLTANGVSGFGYKLNEISDGYKQIPEQFYCFCFDKEKYLLSLTDKDETEAIERAVVNNILRNESISKFPTHEATDSNGRDFDYYTTGYTDSQREGHNVEFVFTDIGTDGILVMLYVFTQSDHKDDIMMVINSVR